MVRIAEAPTGKQAEGEEKVSRRKGRRKGVREEKVSGTDITVLNNIYIGS
jgi:hypothetical protein